MESVKTTITADHSRNFTVLEEIDNLKPTEEEVRLYAKGLGIDPDKEEYLLPIAQEGVSAPLPGGWQALRVNILYHFNNSRAGMVRLFINKRSLGLLFMNIHWTRYIERKLPKLGRRK